VADCLPRRSVYRVAGNMEKATQSTHRHAPLVPAAEENAVDLATKHAGRKVWLIKVPEFVAKEWRRACHDTTSSAPRKPSQQDDNGLTTEDRQHKQEPDRTTLRQQGESPVILGTLSIGQGVTLRLSDSFEGSKELPKEYNLVNNARAGPSMMVFSDDGDGLYRSVEGIVQHRLDVNARDIQDAYRRVSRERFKREAEGGSRKKRTVKMMTDSKIIDIRKPVGAVQKKKERKDTLLLEKRVAMDKNELLPVLFRLFQRQSQWTFTQLQKETNQPTQHLKSVLGEIAMQNKAGPYKDMWELSKESKVHV